MAPLQRQSNPGPLPDAPAKRDLPAAYHETYLRILTRDPGHIFAFWEFAPEAFATAAAAAGKDGEGFSGMLRLFMADSAPSDRGCKVADFPLEEGEGSRYIPVPAQGRSYRLESGFATRSGRFVSLCSSNEVLTPDTTIHAKTAPPEPDAATHAKPLLPGPDTTINMEPIPPGPDATTNAKPILPGPDATISTIPVLSEPAAEQPTTGESGGHPDAAPVPGALSREDGPGVHASVCFSDAHLCRMDSSAQCIPSPLSDGLAGRRHSLVW